MNPVSSLRQKGLAVVVVAEDESLIFTEGLAPTATPLRIHPPIHTGKKKFENVRDDQTHRGHDAENFGAEYLESIATTIKHVGQILVIAHGKGKSNGFLVLRDYLKKHHPGLETLIIGNIEADLTSMSEHELLALSREWLKAHALFLG